MSDAVALRTPLRVDQVMSALHDASREWRESKIPASLRNDGVYALDLRVTGTSFTLRSRLGRRSPYRPLVAGIVSPATDDAGSVVQITVRSTLASRIGFGVWISSILIISVLTRDATEPWFTVVGFCLVGAAMGCAMCLVGYRLTADERAALVGWVAKAIQAQSPQND